MLNRPPFPMLTSDPRQARAAINAARFTGRRTGVVMTMGALHDGHLSLVRGSVAQNDFTAVTLFVNPTQFGPREDFARYPRGLDQDRALLAELPVDLIFAPSVDAMYPEGFSTYVEPPRVARDWEGAFRPGHFRGVTTVVLKLLQILPADHAYFGHKDYQQALVVRRMVTDLDVPTQIEVLPTIREPDGLAMSSRNQYLSSDDRTRASAIFRALELGARLVREGERRRTVLATRIRHALTEAGITEIDYLALVDPQTLVEADELPAGGIALVAARVGNTRLIDNRVLDATDPVLPS